MRISKNCWYILSRYSKSSHWRWLYYESWHDASQAGKSYKRHVFVIVGVVEHLQKSFAPCIYRPYLPLFYTLRAEVPLIFLDFSRKIERTPAHREPLCMRRIDVSLNDHRSCAAHNLNSSEIKAWKKSATNGIRIKWAQYIVNRKTFSN